MKINDLNVIVADDHPIFRLGSVELIKQKIGIKKIREATNGEETITLIKESVPDILILDIEMPILNGIEVLEWIQMEGIRTKTIILTFFKERALYEKLMDMGACGFLLKENALSELEMAIKEVLNGGKYLSKELEHALKENANELLENTKVLDQIKLLTNTEKKILFLIAENVPSKEIAEKLFVSSKTIKNHRSNILKKLQLDGSQNSLLKFALINKSYLE